MHTSSPRKFNGTAEQADANFRTHYFDNEDARCWNCDCRPWGLWASWPCGVSEEEMDAAGAELPNKAEHARLFGLGFAIASALADEANNNK
jgi:hypothetical protein